MIRQVVVKAHEQCVEFRGYRASVTPGIVICSMGNCMPESQFQMPSRQRSCRHRSVISRAASWGSLVWAQMPLTQADMSSWSRVERMGIKGGAGGCRWVAELVAALWVGALAMYLGFGMRVVDHHEKL